jgi:hypothetical protein
MANQGELSQQDLAALDIVLKAMEAKGVKSLTASDIAFGFIDDIWNVVQQVVPVVVQITPALAEEGGRAQVRSPEEGLRALLDKGEVTLDELVQARQALGR